VNWILWSDVSSTAIIIIPEEAECLIPIIRDEASRKTYLMTYAAPVTRRMLHFQNLDYYTIPALPVGWQAPQWLKAELGLFAGRLYFEWEEYSYLASLYGISGERDAVEDGKEVVETDGNAETDGAIQADGANESDDDAPDTAQTVPPKTFVSRPLNFMQEWLAVRRRGQDFSHTPLGFIASGKPLFADHPFFRQEESEERAAAAAAATLRAVTGGRIVADRKDQVEEEVVVYEGGIDVPVSDSDSSSGEESVEYHDDELYSAADDEEEEDGAGSPELPSLGDDGRRGRGRGNRGGKGGRRR